MWLNVQLMLFLKVCNAAKIEMPDHSVDMVFCHQTFHHIIDQENAIKEFLSRIKTWWSIVVCGVMQKVYSFISYSCFYFGIRWMYKKQTRNI